MNRFVVISGCSSGGKSTLVVELGRRGYAVVEEPGRRIVKEELAVRASLHRTAVGQLERGERVARVDTAVKLAGSLGIHPGELLDGMGWDPGGTRLGRFTER